MTKVKTESAVQEDRRSISLIRIEAAYGPIYLVVDNISPFKPGTPKKEVLDWAAVCVESLGEPDVTLRNVLAVIKDGRCCPPDIFTHIKSVEVAVDFDFEKEIHRTQAGVFQWFPEARS